MVAACQKTFLRVGEIAVGPSDALDDRKGYNAQLLALALPCFASNGFPYEEVLQHKFPFSPYKRTTTDLAGYLAILRLRPSFYLDYLIKSFAVRACEWIECASRHGTSPKANSTRNDGQVERFRGSVAYTWSLIFLR